MLVSTSVAAQWQIVEDDFLYLRQENPGGSVILYCSKPGHRLFPAVFVWPKPVSADGRRVKVGVVRLQLPDAEKAKALVATMHGNTASVKLDRDMDDLLERLQLAAQEGGSVRVQTQAVGGEEMTMEISLVGYLDVLDGFDELCMKQSEDLLERLGGGRRTR